MPKPAWRRVAKVAVAAVFDPTGLKTASTAANEVLDWLGEVLPNAERKRVDQWVRRLEKDLEKAAKSEGVGGDELEPILVTVEDLLRRHALSADELHGMDLDHEKAAQEVLERGKKLVEPDQVSWCDLIVRETYRSLLADPGQLQSMTLSFRQAVLGRLARFDQLADDTADAVRACLLPAAVTSGLETLRPGAAPSSYLRAEFRVVPFIGRDTEMESLEEWCARDQPVGVRLYNGPGGTGKTRLMLEACLRLAPRGWRAGFLSSDLATAAFRAEALDQLVREPRPLFLVVDYAERRHDVVTGLLRAVHLHRSPEHRVRVVLVARAVGEWWEALRGESGLRDLLRGANVDLPIPLQPLAADDLDLRHRTFREAARAFAARLPEGGDAHPEPPDLSKDVFADVLLLHLAALAAVGGNRPDETLVAHLDYLLDREADHLAQRGKDLAPNRTALVRAAALVTLAGPLEDRDAARKALSRSPDFRNSPGHEVAAVADLLHDLYPSRTWLNGLQPDLLGERLVETRVVFAGGGGSMDRDLLLTVLGSEADRHQKEEALTVLSRAAQRREMDVRSEEERREIRERWTKRMTEILLLDLLGLAEVAIEVAQQSSVELHEIRDPLGKALAEALRTADDEQLAAGLLGKLPPTQRTVALREVGVVVAEEALAQLDRKDDGDEVLMQRAKLKNELSNRLTDLGLREVAVSPSEEAVQIQRVLLSSNPQLYKRDLAGYLSNLSLRLQAVGRHEDALSAIEEAVEINRELSSSQTEASPSDLAISLHNLSKSLGNLGRWERALSAIEEAVQIRRVLSLLQPEAFRPSLAMSLNNLSKCLDELGRRSEALSAIEEAVEIRRELSLSRPEAFRPDLAVSLNNLSNRLLNIERREDALSAINESVRIFRALSSSRPAVFQPSLAQSLNNQSNCLSSLGRHEEALSAIEEAVEIRRALSLSRPEVFRADLAQSLSNLSLHRLTTRRREDALSSIEEATDIYRELTSSRPEAFVPALAMSLNISSRCSWELGHHEKALSVIKEALEMLSPFFFEHPWAFEHRMKILVSSYLLEVKEAGRAPDSELLRPLLELLHQLDQKGGDKDDYDDTDVTS